MNEADDGKDANRCHAQEKNDHQHKNEPSVHLCIPHVLEHPSEEEFNEARQDDDGKELERLVARLVQIVHVLLLF